MKIVKICTSHYIDQYMFRLVVTLFHRLFPQAPANNSLQIKRRPALFDFSIGFSIQRKDSTPNR